MAIVSSLAAAVVALGGGVARGDHTKEDARATTAKLEALLHPRKARPKPKPVTPPTTTVAVSATATATATATASATPSTPARRVEVVDPLWSLMVHAISIPFDAKEREAHLRDIPKNAKELDAHLRRLDAALQAPHARR